MTAIDPSWTVSSRQALLFMQLADSLEVSRQRLISDCDLDPLWLENPDFRMPVAAIYKLAKRLAELSGNEDIGLLVGRVSYLNLVSLILYLPKICDNLRQWLNMMPSVMEMQGDIGESVVIREGDSIRTQWNPLINNEHSGRYFADMILASSVSLLQSVCIQPVKIQKAYFAYPEPVDLSLHHQIFGEQLFFEQSFSGLFFDIAALDYPLVKPLDEAALRLHENILGAVDRDSGDGFLRQMRRSIVKALPSGAMSIDSIAEELSISRRTLQRRLSERNTHFLNEVQDIRSAIASRLLKNQQMGITEIAFLLGYADSSSFSTAFKSWHGISPKDYAQQHGDDKL
ncbi:AraC family transcriptional regulator [uncultured Pseudoteredinibacter sp.]|uniref:AraC family transcriptional regulator n=1 Tax=uncultured Pseudoteredinibacter sp. TaxID=1641701 RepID=UPI00260D166A|nr:AraC family transcriptional regulator [uncultured Pseudoteredinibacter sp.]